MLGIITISGEVSHSRISMFLGPEHQKGGYLDSSLLQEGQSFTCIDNQSVNCCRIALRTGLTTEVIFSTTNALAVIKPVCNVPFRITRDYNIVQWAAYFCINCIRHTKRLFSLLKEMRL